MKNLLIFTIIGTALMFYGYDLFGCSGCGCQAKKETVKAAKLLMKHGFSNVFDYKNGIAEWKEAKLPLGTGKVCDCGMVKGSPLCCK